MFLFLNNKLKKINTIIILISALPSILLAESELASYKNMMPFKYKPSASTELSIQYINKQVLAFYPDGKIQVLIEKLVGPASLSPNITTDLNFDGYTDVAINTWLAPRGLNSGYSVFLWDKKKKKLIKSSYFVNPSIESNFIIENNLSPSPMCAYNTPLCVYQTRHQWINGRFQIHSYITEVSNSNVQIRFVKGDSILKSIVVPSDNIELETKKWNETINKT